MVCVTFVRGGICVEMHGILRLAAAPPGRRPPGAADAGGDEEGEERGRPGDGEDDLGRGV